MNIREFDPLDSMFTMFVLSMVTASVVAIPVIIAATQTTAVWRLLRKI